MSWQVVFAIKSWQQPHLLVLFAAEHCIANDYNITNWPTVYFTKHPNFQINLQQQGKGSKLLQIINSFISFAHVDLMFWGNITNKIKQQILQ